MDKKIFAIIGGDQRSGSLAQKLAEDNHDVRIYGSSRYKINELEESANLYEAITGAQYIIGPTPCSQNEGVLNAMFHKEKIYLDDVFRLIKPTQLFIAGYIKPEVLTIAKKYDISIIDMLDREELLLLNTIPTAEGAIKIAIEETDVTIHDSDIMITGYGRIGRLLANMLKGMGARVSAVVNRAEKAAQAKSDGHEVVFYEEMSKHLKSKTVIFNTVPKIIIDASNMKYIDKECLIIDLASSPYGVDCISARELGLKVLYANSLPGKIAPVTTAKYMAETIYNIIEERSEDLVAT